MNTDFLTIRDVAAILKVPQRTVAYLISNNLLAAIAFDGGHTLIERSALQDFIEKHRQPAREKREPERV